MLQADAHQLDSSEMFHFKASWTFTWFRLRHPRRERYKRVLAFHFLTKIDTAQQALIFAFISSRIKSHGPIYKSDLTFGDFTKFPFHQDVTGDSGEVREG